MNNKVLVTFAGSHDLTPNEKAPITRIIKYLKPDRCYLFITTEYEKHFEENDLYSYYKSLTGDIEFIKSGIDDPTNFEEISSKTSDKIEEISAYVVENKGQAYLNLTSGTPAIISVLSLYAITGLLNRAVGMYAPNTKYDDNIRNNSLEFYKDSVAYKTVKSMINSMDYVGLCNFIENEKGFPKLKQNKEFMDMIRFAKERVLCNFDEAQKIYDDSEYLKKLEFHKPKNLYEKSVECYMSALISERNRDYFQSIIKLAIIRENLMTYLLYDSDKSLAKDLVRIDKEINKKKTKYTPRLRKKVMEGKYQDLIDVIKKAFGSIDYTREVNATMMYTILCHLIGEDSELSGFKRKMVYLEELKGARNEIAHNVAPPRYEHKWMVGTKDMIVELSKYMGLEEPGFDFYEKLNQEELLKNLRRVIYG